MERELLLAVPRKRNRNDLSKKAALIGVALVAIAGAVYAALAAGDGAGLVATRDVLFTRWVDGDEFREWAASPASRVGSPAFRGDAPEHRAAFAREVDWPGLGADSAAGATDMSKVIAIVSRFRGMGGMDCGSLWHLKDQVAALLDPAPYGCCSDFSAGFTALGQVEGVEVREVTNEVHSFNEFFDHQLNQWVFVDPMIGLMAKASGRWLSAAALRAAMQNGQAVEWVFIDKQVTRDDQVRAIAREYNSERWRQIRIIRGSDVIRQDLVMARLDFLPKSAAQLGAYLFFERPPFVGTRDSFEGD
jgi:hypothetical protein